MSAVPRKLLLRTLTAEINAQMNTVNPYVHPRRLLEGEKEMSGFGLAPTKREGARLNSNPKLHPKHLRTTAAQLRAHAQAYFAWELMHGTDVEELREDPYWSYMEEKENDNPTTATTDGTA